ncbi:MAG TPA: hypothetical protein VLO11_05045 [Luteolibacter sp.]|nr:hypothetical protein [Luteolibacter sp.]
MKHSLVTGTASLVMILSGTAGTIYSNLLNTEIPLDFDGVDISIGNGTLNPFFGGVGVANNSALQPFRTGTGGLDTILNFSAGSLIDAGSLHLSTGPGGSQGHLGSTFTAGQEGYIGFKLDDAHFGWARVVFTNNTGGAVVRDWAYATGGTGIVAGGIRQVEQDILLSSSFTLSSALADSGVATHLVMNHGGTNSLTAANSHSGNTVIASGILSIDGSGSINNSAVTISGGNFRYNSSVAYDGALTFTGGTISGTNLTGTLGGLVIGENQILSPGNSPGTAETTSQTWAGGGTYRWEINDAAGSAGADPGWDLVAGTGTLNISADENSPFTIAVTSLGLNNVEGDAAAFDQAASYNWLIADFDAVVSFASSAFAIDTSGFSNPFDGSFAIASGEAVFGGDSSQIYLTYTPVPEPRALLLAGLGALLLLRRGSRADQ